MKNSIYHLQELPDHMDILLKCKIISNGWNTTLRQQNNKTTRQHTYALCLCSPTQPKREKHLDRQAKKI
jgi:hypothetical protein